MRKLLIILFSFLFTTLLFTQNEVYNKMFRDAIAAGKEKDVVYWLEKGADINCLDKDGFSALHLALKDQNKVLADYLLQRNANVNVVDLNKSTPIMYSAYQGDLRMCYFLYKKGANLELKDNFGNNSKDYAKKQGFLRVAKFLVDPISYSEEPTYFELLESAEQYFNNQDVQNSIIYGEKSKETAKIELTPNNIFNATILGSLGMYYRQSSNYEKSELLLKESLRIRKNLIGENDLYFAVSLNNLGLLYVDMGNYIQAEALYVQALSIRKAKLGGKHPDYAISLSNLGDLHVRMGNYTKAVKLYTESLKIKKEVLGITNPDYAISLGLFSVLYYKMGDYSKAEVYIKECLKIQKEVIGENHPYYANSLGILASIYMQTGNYVESEQLYEQSLQIRKKIFGENHPAFAVALNNLARFYNEIGNNVKTELFYKQAIEIRKNVLGENHPEYAISLNNLALFYNNQGDYISAEPLFLQALKIHKEVLGENDPSYANTLNNLASLYHDMKLYEKAEKLYLESLEIIKSALGESNPDYGMVLNNLGDFYQEMKDYDKAEVYFNNSLLILKDKKNSPNYPITLSNLGDVFQMKCKYDKAEPLYLEMCDILKTDIKSNFKFLSEKERDFYWNNKEFSFNIYYPSFAFNYHPQKSSISTFAYDNILFTKGLLLNTSLQIQNAVLQSGDRALINTWENIRGLKRTINILQSKPLAQQGDLSVMEAQADSLDKVLTQKSQLYKQSQYDMQIIWTDVQKNLKPDEAAIEFISFNYFNKHYTDSTMYCALVLKKDSKFPEMIPLFEEKQLDSLFVKSSADVNQLYTYRVTNLRKDTVESTLNYGSKLYNLLWKPLEASLKNTKTVYYAPSGKLNQVAFAAIPVDSTLLLSEKYNLHQLTSTRQVIKNSNAANKLQEAALFGGIQYELDNKQLAQVQTTTTTGYRSAFVSDSTQRSTAFGYLKGTSEEVTGIAEKLKQKGLTDQLYTGSIASEAAFKKLNGTNTDIIHIATHGFYLPIEDTKPKDFKFMSFDNDRRNVVVHNPLLRSGLAFAGANRAWRGDSLPDSWEDGILTSHEISQINLTHTDLVVLSACETALGDVKGSEGVFGLQRAFKMAGVQTLIMSLWKVPDTQTSQLMQGFYKYWLGGMTKHDAFKKSQNEIRKANPNPYYWAAFVMVD